MRTLVFISLLLSYYSPTFAQDTISPPRPIEYKFNLHFPNNYFGILHDFEDNQKEIDRIDSLLSDSLFCISIDSIRLSSSASPEGNISRNRVIAANRVWAAHQHLVHNYSCFKGQSRILWTIVHEDWERMYQYIDQSTEIANAQLLISQMRSAPSIEERKRILMQSNNGKDYKHIKRHVLPLLRNTEICFYTDKTYTPVTSAKVQEAEHITDSILSVVKSTEPPRVPLLISGNPSILYPSTLYPSTPVLPALPADNINMLYRHQSRFALKTNLLYWAATFMNIEGELYFNKRLSLNIDYQYAWWSNRSKHRYIRLAAVSPEGRFWFSTKNRFKGHFAGLYVGAGLYEFMFKPSHGIQGEFFIAGGLTYGYMFPIGKRLRMELSIGVGYMMTEYREYYWDRGCYVYEKTQRYSYLGPTKAKVSLVYPLYWFNKKYERPVR